MAGGILQIVGLVALLCLGSRCLIRSIDRRLERARALAEHRLMDYSPPAPGALPWPMLEPEVEELRRKAAL